uniref:Uncharacterized protein n=1 Tax=Panagrolaimus superbus TaxID=310955 RepID=A0A914Y852_9BILA
MILNSANATSNPITEFETHMRHADPLNVVMLESYRREIDEIAKLVEENGPQMLSEYEWYRSEKDVRGGNTECECCKEILSVESPTSLIELKVAYLLEGTLSRYQR